MRNHLTTRTAKSATAKRSLTLLGVVAICAALAGYAIAAPRRPAVDAPAITSGPSGATQSTSARFAFRGTRGVVFECSLDDAAFRSCRSPKSYGGLSEGRHAFAVRAVNRRGQRSSATTRRWTVDRTAPPAPQIVQAPPSITNELFARFAYTDAEAGVTYVCKLVPVAYDDCTNPVSWWGLHAGTAEFSVRARDAAGNLSAPTTYSWVVDTQAPASPTLVQTPPATTSATSATFAFSGAESGGGYQCRLDGAGWSGCGSPEDYDGLSAGRHDFAVRAYDAAGNHSGPVTYAWIVEDAVGVGEDFVVRGGFDGLLSPGVSGDLAVTITNPNDEPIQITSLTVTIEPGSTRAGCDGPANLRVTQSDVSVANPLTVHANDSVTLPAGGVGAPQVAMLNLPTNQDACKGAIFTFTYGGSAHS